MRSSLGVLAVVLALSGCKSEKFLGVEADLAATKARLAVLERRRQELTGKLKQLEVERRTFSKQADESELARVRLAAALAVLDGKPIPDGLLLDDALRSKDADLGALAAKIVQRQLPCEDPNAQPAGVQNEGDCRVPELEDHCADVSPTFPQAFEWACREIVQGGKVPAAAVCDSSALLAATDFPVSAPGATVHGDVVRVLFERQGRLVVGDWPPPGVSIYRPENTNDLGFCRAQNENEQCIRGCDEKFGRLNDGCEDFANMQANGPFGIDMDDDGTDESEPYEVRRARQEAEQAQRDAAEAEREAERARDELSYQECLATCGTGEDLEPQDPTIASLEYRRSPAPGLFEFQSQVGDADGGLVLHSWVLSFPAMFEAAAGTLELPKEETVLRLETELAVDHLVEGEVGPNKKLLAGVAFDGRPVAIEATIDGSESPVIPSDEAICDFAKKQKHRPLLDACQRLPAKTPGEADAGGAP